MRLLITGSDTLPGQNILAALLREGFDAQGLIYRGEPQATLQAALDDIKPRIIVNAHQWAGILQNEQNTENCRLHNAEMVRYLADYAALNQLSLVQLSSCYVFDGTKQTPYKSSNQANPINCFGQAKWQAEQYVRDTVPSSIVLRLGWLIGLEPVDVLERLLVAKREGQPAFFSDEHRGNPTAPEDVARVVVAIIKQVLCDAPVWGTYQYAGAEIVSQLAFARAAAEHLMDGSDAVGLIQTAGAEQIAQMKEPKNASLACVRIRNTFGIKQRPWRNYLSAIIEQYLNGKSSSPQESLPEPKLSASSQ